MLLDMITVVVVNGTVTDQVHRDCYDQALQHTGHGRGA